MKLCKRSSKELGRKVCKNGRKGLGKSICKKTRKEHYASEHEQK